MILIIIIYSFKPGFFLYSAPNTTVLAGFQRVLRGERADFQHFLILSTGVPWLLWPPSVPLLLSPPSLSLAPTTLLLKKLQLALKVLTWLTQTSLSLLWKTWAAA